MPFEGYAENRLEKSEKIRKIYNCRYVLNYATDMDVK
jgi:hypothetical protein